MSHALGVTLACLWDVPERACGRRWRKSIPPSAVARRAMADKKARSTPRSPEHAAYGGSRDDPATSLPRSRSRAHREGGACAVLWRHESAGDFA